jgi:hypothetical protein
MLNQESQTGHKSASGKCLFHLTMPRTPDWITEARKRRSKNLIKTVVLSSWNSKPIEDCQIRF